MKNISLLATLLFVLIYSNSYAQKTINQPVDTKESLRHIINLGNRGFIITTFVDGENETQKYTMYDWDLNQKWVFDTKEVTEDKEYYQLHFLSNPFSEKVFASLRTTRLLKAFQSSKPKEDDIINVTIDKDGNINKTLEKESLLKSSDKQFIPDFKIIANNKVLMGVYENIEKKKLTVMFYWFDPETSEMVKKKTELERGLDELKDEDHTTPGIFFLGNTDNSVLLAKKTINNDFNEAIFTVYELDFEGKIIKTTEMSISIKGEFSPTLFSYDFYNSEEQSYKHQICCISYSRNLKGDILRDLDGNSFRQDYASTCISSYHFSNIKYDDKYNYFYIYGVGDLSGKGKNANSYFVYKFDREGNKISGNQMDLGATIDKNYRRSEWRRTLVDLDIVDSTIVKFIFSDYDIIGVLYTNCEKTLNSDIQSTPKVKGTHSADAALSLFNTLGKANSNAKYDNAEAAKYYHALFIKSGRFSIDCVHYYDKKVVVSQEKGGDQIEVAVFK